MKVRLPWPKRETALDLPIPDGYVMFWPTGRCNFRCQHCKLPILNEKRQELSFAEITTFFERSRILRELPISIAGGEPFIRNDLVDILDVLTRRGHPVFVTSNGWYLEKMKKLSGLARPDLVTIGVSIDGIAATHDAIRRKGSFDRTAQALEIARAAGCHVQVNTVVQPENLGEIEAIADHFQRIGVRQVFIPLATFPNTDDRHLTPETHYPDDQIADLARWSNSQPTDTKYVLSRGAFRISDCHAGSSSCYIDPEGDVYACMTMKELAERSTYKIGSLREFDLDFDALWASDRAWEVRRAVKACAGCYAGCEVSRETVRHGLDGTIDAATIASRLGAPSELGLADPTSSPYLTGDWYFVERADFGGFRWMGRRAGVRLLRPTGAAWVTGRIQAHHPDLADRPIQATVYVDGARAGSLALGGDDRGRSIDVRLPLPVPAAGRLAEIEIEVDRTWVPRDLLGTADTRRLGLVVERLGFA